MKKKFFYFICSAFLIFSFCGKETSLNTKLRHIQNKHDIAGMSVTLVKDGNIVYSKGFGLRDIERGLPVDRNTKYRIASISKFITGIAMMQLYEKGLFKLDEDVSDALGFTLRNPSFPDQPITYSMLMSHTSSLRDCAAYFDFLFAGYSDDPPENMRDLFLPGTDYYSDDVYDSARAPADGFFQYGNINFGILAALIERLSGERFDLYCVNHIFQPLGLSCRFSPAYLVDINNLAVLYRKKDSVWTPQADHYKGIRPEPMDLNDYVPGSNGFLFAPQGGLRASSEDLAVIMVALMNGGVYQNVRILRDSTAATMLEPVWIYKGEESGENLGGLFENYALCNHMTTSLLPGATMAGHSGLAYGLISNFYFSRGRKFGVVFISNGGSWQKSDTGWFTAEQEVTRLCAEKLMKSL